MKSTDKPTGPLDLPFRPRSGRPPKFFQPLETIFPIIGNPATIFSNHWKKRQNFPTIGNFFSNHWKLFFQSLENFLPSGISRVLRNEGGLARVGRRVPSPPCAWMVAGTLQKGFSGASLSRGGQGTARPTQAFSTFVWEGTW